MTRCSVRVRASLTPAKGRHSVPLLVLAIFCSMLLLTEQARMPGRLAVDYPLRARRAMLSMCPEKSSEQIDSPDGGLEVMFKFPRDAKSFLVAWCAKFKKNCGEKAAHAYCEEMGFEKSTAWEQFADAGLQCGQTRYIREPQRICSGGSCKGFTFITCVQREKE